MKEVAKKYQVIIFTASHSTYADTILDYLKIDNIISARLYWNSCYTTTDNVYVKDLRIFEDQWDLKDIVLIDNSTHSFGF